ncbi:MAG: hypothetical protein LCH89_00355 [Proteobacteria bacterium]|nr:hypothetical protein [Pseudomonadota bacterium]
MFDKPHTRLATPDDAAELAVTMRDADLRELALGSHSGPYDALMRGLVYSAEARAVVTAEGEVAAIYGVVPQGHGRGSPWLLGADCIQDIAVPFLRGSRSVVAEMHLKYPLLHHQVWEGNTLHVRWLRWLGFTVEPSPTTRPNFLNFWRTNHV